MAIACSSLEGRYSFGRSGELFLDPLELLPPDRAVPTPTAQHFAPVMPHGPMDPQQCPKIPGDAVVCIVTTDHLIEVIRLLVERQVPHPPLFATSVDLRARKSIVQRLTVGYWIVPRTS